MAGVDGAGTLVLPGSAGPARRVSSLLGRLVVVLRDARAVAERWRRFTVLLAVWSPAVEDPRQEAAP